MQTVKLFWTGGSDSTYRLVELSRMEVEIQPIYVINFQRQSLKMEQDAMEDILALIDQKDETKATIRPVRFINKNDFLPIDKDIKKAYKTYRRRCKIGSQELWLAQICRNMPDVERCFERSDKADIRYPNFMKDIRAANLKEVHDKNVSYCILEEPPNNPDDEFILFGNSRYPLPLAQMTKKECYAQMKAWDCEGIYLRTVFCSFPINGEPCGYCGPCRSVLEEGMAFRMPESAKKRNRFQHLWRLRCKVLQLFNR